jgi:hypothetical protein
VKEALNHASAGINPTGSEKTRRQIMATKNKRLKFSNICVLTLTLCATQITQAVETATTSQNAVNKAILKELREIKKQLKSINAKLEKKQNISLDNFTFPIPTSSSFTEKKISLSVLDKIKLPKNPTDADIKKYIYAIMWLSKDQRSFSPSDPQVAKFTELGAERLPIMVQCLDNSNSLRSYHLLQAIIRLTDDNHKEIIIKALPKHKELVRAILSEGWENDARKELIIGLKRYQSYIPYEWVQAVVNLNDPKTYPLLREYFIKGQNKSHTYNTIKNLPIKNMDDAVSEAWRRTPYDKYHRTTMSAIAVKYGHKDALEYLIDALLEKSNFYNVTPRATVLKHIDFSGDNKAIQKWFRKNKSKLVFNKITKKFKLP